MSLSTERRTQEERSASTRQAVLDATIACLVEHGYAGTSTTAIQERAGVSRGALTHQFPSKNELLAAAITHLADVRLRDMGEPSDDGDRLEAGLRVLWDTFNTDVFAAAIELWVASRTDDDLHAVLIEAERAIARSYFARSESLYGEIARRPGFARGLESVVIHMRGAALTDVLRRSTKTEQTIGECVDILRAALEET